jgi:hypothetical protein
MAAMNPDPRTRDDHDGLRRKLCLSQTQRTALLSEVARAEGLRPAPNAGTEAQRLHGLMARIPELSAPFPGDLISLSYLAYYLKAPRLLLQMLELFHPHLLRRSAQPLRVLYLGASKHEVFDEGRWFAFAFGLAGIQREVRITAVGPELAKDPEAVRPSPYPHVVGMLPSTLDGYFPTTLCDALTEGHFAPDWEQYWDVVVMHHPGFIGHWRDWDDDDAWHDLISFAEIPVIGTAFDPADLLVDRLALATYSRPITHAWWNPAAHFNPCAGADAYSTRWQWGGVLWSSERHPDTRENQSSAFQRQAADEFNEYWGTLFHLLEAFGPDTSLVRVSPMQRSEFGDRIWMADQASIDVASGELHLHGVTYAATDLTRRIAATPTCAERMRFGRQLADQIAAQR